MKESQDVLSQFVKIVERFPVLYDNSMPHRPQVCMLAWEKVAEAVRHELKEDCTVDELRLKWKGIRSSFTRFKKKLHLESKDTNSKPYYLYDTLKFLHQHTKPKWLVDTTKEDTQDSENDDDWVQNVTIKAIKGGFNQSTPMRTYSNTKDPLAIERKKMCLTEELKECSAQIKKEPLDDYIDGSNRNIVNNTEEELGSIKRSSSTQDGNEASACKIIKTEENTDLQFFNSIVPDIAHFTTQEKRKFKMGVLKLIDEIEESRNSPNDSLEKFES